MFTGQAQIRFLTAPPELLCQGKLALQNRSLTGKCVSLFISHSHWKKGGVGEWLVMLSFFPRNFSKASHFTVTSRHCLCFAAQYGTELAKNMSFSSFSLHSAPPPTSFWGFYSLRVLQAALKRTWKAKRCRSFLSVSLREDLHLGKQLLVGGMEGSCRWLQAGRKRILWGQICHFQRHQRIENK